MNPELTDEPELKSSAIMAVIFADMVSYTRHMAKDQEGTVAILENNKNVALDLLKKHEGRMVKTTGDGFLAVFATASRAVEFSACIFRRLKHQASSTGSECTAERSSSEERTSLDRQ